MGNALINSSRSPKWLASAAGWRSGPRSGQGRPIKTDLGKISGDRATAWWFNPRTGTSEKIDTFENQGTRTFIPHQHGGFGTDNVLVLDDASINFPAPGSGTRSGLGGH